MDRAVEVTIAIFIAGVVYYAGRLSARVDNLERWRAEMLHTLDKIHGAIRAVEQLIRHGSQ